MTSKTGTNRLQYGSRRQNPAPAPARCRRDVGTAAAVTAQPEPARCIASLHFRRLSTVGWAAGGRNCRCGVVFWPRGKLTPGQNTI